eukprot:TRINITY_DN8586_c0_g1_i1.p1 TRINITY_DN8586_c0_g1~~TRINITY_DN8586_c0_g1_i1.p1  ORF type:complete len:752 (-),score=193.47 TRINITY_DN8586_c0_g1_i1:485-2740(-)
MALPLADYDPLPTRYDDPTQPVTVEELEDLTAWAATEPPSDWRKVVDDEGMGLIVHHASQETSEGQVFQRGRADFLLPAPLDTALSLLTDPGARKLWDELLGEGMERHEARGQQFRSFRFDGMYGLAVKTFFVWSRVQAFDRLGRPTDSEEKSWSYATVWRHADVHWEGLPRRSPDCDQKIMQGFVLERVPEAPHRKTRIVCFLKTDYRATVVTRLLAPMLPSLIPSFATRYANKVLNIVQAKGLQGLAQVVQKSALEKAYGPGAVKSRLKEMAAKRTAAREEADAAADKENIDVADILLGPNGKPASEAVDLADQQEAWLAEQARRQAMDRLGATAALQAEGLAEQERKAARELSLQAARRLRAERKAAEAAEMKALEEFRAEVETWADGDIRLQEVAAKQPSARPSPSAMAAAAAASPMEETGHTAIPPAASPAVHRLEVTYAEPGVTKAELRSVLQAARDVLRASPAGAGPDTRSRSPGSPTGSPLVALERPVADVVAEARAALQQRHGKEVTSPLASGRRNRNEAFDLAMAKAREQAAAALRLAAYTRPVPKSPEASDAVAGTSRRTSPRRGREEDAGASEVLQQPSWPPPDLLPTSFRPTSRVQMQMPPPGPAEPLALAVSLAQELAAGYSAASRSPGGLGALPRSRLEADFHWVRQQPEGVFLPCGTEAAQVAPLSERLAAIASEGGGAPVRLPEAAASKPLYGRLGERLPGSRGSDTWAASLIGGMQAQTFRPPPWLAAPGNTA